RADLSMAVSLREYRARIKSVESTKKITRAMELIAASRIIKAQQRAQSAAPYARELTRAVSAVATYSNVDHPLTTEPERPKRAAQTIGEGDDEREVHPGVDEVHVVFTQFRSMLVQEPRDIRLLPLEVVEGDEPPPDDEVLPLYEFEPSAEEVLDGLLPKYVES